MLNIKMNSVKSETQITEILNEVQKHCTVRLLSFDKIKRILEEVEDTAKISKTALTGTKIIFDYGQKFPSAYKYIPESTQFKALHNGKTWIITYIGRDPCPNRFTNILIDFSDSAKQAIIKKLSISYIYI